MAEDCRYWKEGGKTRSYVRGVACFLCLFFGFVGNQPTRRARDVAIINTANMVAPYVIFSVCIITAAMWYGAMLQYKEYVYIQSALYNTDVLVTLSLEQLMKIDLRG